MFKMSTDNQDINNIAFEKINDKFSRGKYGDFDVIIMKENGYINATKLCIHVAEITGSRKVFRNWSMNTSAKDLIDSAACEAGIPASQLTIVVSSGKNQEIKGTYVHPDLVPHIASWASPEFAIKVSKIVNKYFIKKALKEKEKIIKEKNKLIEEKEDKIDMMSRKIDKLLEKNDELLEYGKSTKKELKRITRQNKFMIRKLKQISENRVIDTEDENDKSIFAIIKNNVDDVNEDGYQYQVLRLMKGSYATKISSYQLSYPHMEILTVIDCPPNAMMFWRRVKEVLAKGRRKKLDVNGCKFNINDNYSEERLVDKINDLHEERLVSEENVLD